MKRNISHVFSIVVIAVMLVLTLRTIIMAEIGRPAADTGEEIPRLLSDSSGDTYLDIAAEGVSGNSLLQWGIVRGGPGRQPRPDPGTPELLAKYNSLYIGDTGKGVIYLTFDEGYEKGYTSKILDVLYENEVNAIFFITGPYLEKEEALVRRMVEEGHAVGNHTVSHKSLPTLSDEEIEKETSGLDRMFYGKF